VEITLLQENHSSFDSSKGIVKYEIDKTYRSLGTILTINRVKISLRSTVHFTVKTLASEYRSSYDDKKEIMKHENDRTYRMLRYIISRPHFLWVPELFPSSVTSF
jgi:hypothetical protein